MNRINGYRRVVAGVVTAILLAVLCGGQESGRERVRTGR